MLLVVYTCCTSCGSSWIQKQLLQFSSHWKLQFSLIAVFYLFLITSWEVYRFTCYQNRQRTCSIENKHAWMLVRKFIDGKWCENFAEYFSLLSHEKRTRHNTISLNLPSVRTEFSKRSVCFSPSWHTTLWQRWFLVVIWSRHPTTLKKRCYNVAFLTSLLRPKSNVVTT